MRLSISLLASMGLVGTIAAQAQNNDFDMYSGRTNFTTRSAMPGTSVGDIAQPYLSSMMSGLGQYVDPNSGTLVHRLSGWKVVNQDQRASTQEQFTLGLIGDDTANPNNPDAAADILRTAPISTPTSTVTTPAAWIWTVTLATPYDTLPVGSDFYLACGLPSNTAWTADGMSVHMSGWGGSPSDAPYVNGPNPLPNTIFTIDRTGTPVVSGLADKFQRIWYFSPAANLKVGADIDPLVSGPTTALNMPNPAYGAAGLWPDQNTTRLDGVSFRIQDLNNPSSLCGVIGQIGGPAYPGLPLGPGFLGDLHLNPAFILPITFAQGVMSGGTYQQITFAFPNSWQNGLGVLHFQGVVFDPSFNILITNGYGFNAQ
ncbi:MAG: hypothetical protein AB7I19_07860 [Planctomycetota bacterium]